MLTYRTANSKALPGYNPPCYLTAFIGYLRVENWWQQRSALGYWHNGKNQVLLSSVQLLKNFSKLFGLGAREIPHIKIAGHIRNGVHMKWLTIFWFCGRIVCMNWIRFTYRPSPLQPVFRHSYSVSNVRTMIYRGRTVRNIHSQTKPWVNSRTVLLASTVPGAKISLENSSSLA